MRGQGATPGDDDEPLHVAMAPDALSLFWVENVGIFAWHKPMTAPVIEAVHAMSAARRARYPTGMSFVHIGRAPFTGMDSATRDVFVRVLRELNRYVVATAIVAGSGGFWASAVRSIATGIMVLSRVSHEIRFHDRAEELLTWLPAKHEQATGIKLDIERLRAVLHRAETE